MRFVVRLLPCLVICAAVNLSGCATQNTNTKVAALQRDNARLQADKQKLATEITTLRSKLNNQNTQAEHWAGPNKNRALASHIDQLTRAEVRRQMVQKAIDLAEVQLQQARQGKPQATADAELGLRVARAATTETPQQKTR